MKELLTIGGIVAVAVAVLYVLGRRKQEMAGGTSSTGDTADQCFSVRNFVNTVEEGAGLSIPSIEGQGTGSFSGWRSNVTGMPDQPNVINGTGAAVARHTPNADFASGAQLPWSHLARPRFSLRRATLY